MGNTFYASEWDFVADPLALPTEPGIYRATPDATFPKRDRLLFLDARGTWHWLSPHGTLTNADYDVERFAETITRVEV